MILTQNINKQKKKGYLVEYLSVGSKLRSHLLYRLEFLVLEAFIFKNS